MGRVPLYSFSKGLFGLCCVCFMATAIPFASYGSSACEDIFASRNVGLKFENPADRAKIEAVREILKKSFDKNDLIELVRVVNPGRMNEISWDQPTGVIVTDFINGILRNSQFQQLAIRLSYEFKARRPHRDASEKFGIDQLKDVQPEGIDTSATFQVPRSRILDLTQSKQVLANKALDVLSESLGDADNLSMFVHRVQIGLQVEIENQINWNQSIRGSTKDLIENLLGRESHQADFAVLAQIYRSFRPNRTEADKIAIDRLASLDPLTTAQTAESLVKRVSVQSRESRKLIGAAIEVLAKTLNLTDIEMMVLQIDSTLSPRIYWNQSKLGVLVDLFNNLLARPSYKADVARLAADYEIRRRGQSDANTAILRRLQELIPRAEQAGAAKAAEKITFPVFDAAGSKILDRAKHVLTRSFDRAGLEQLVLAIDPKLEDRLNWKQPLKWIVRDLLDGIYKRDNHSELIIRLINRYKADSHRSGEDLAIIEALRTVKPNPNPS